MDIQAEPVISDDRIHEPPVVHMATGMIAAHLSLSCNDAFLSLHAYTVDRGRTLAAVAEDIITRGLSLTEVGIRADQDIAPS